jgi:hypothetical protein
MENSEKERYLQQISDIKRLMEDNSKFLSLSGLSGIWAGGVALMSAYYVNGTVGRGLLSAHLSSEYGVYRVNMEAVNQLILVAIGTILIALAGAYFFTHDKARKANQRIWGPVGRKMCFELFFTLGIGGIFCLLQLYYGYFGLLAPTTLIFYGLALFNISKYTVNDIRYLGICQVILGLLNAYFIGAGLIFWAIGFGLLHILYGIAMYWKYDRKTDVA